MRALLVLLLAVPGGAIAQPAAIKAGEAENVSVTVYRDPGRRDGPMDRRWPGGYALISERRTVTLPAGDSVVRFEGVAEGLLPETAIVSGFPGGVREKNRDARLLSPAGLVDAYLKRRVHLVRTNRKTGKTTEQDAILQAGPDGGVVLTTAEGVEALGCSGLPERLVYAGVPDGVTPRPTLSVLVRSERATTVTVRLTYLAQGFDWSANYVAKTKADGPAVDLFAWLTVANGGSQGFADAKLQVVAGRPRREANAKPPQPRDPALHLNCWPMDITSTHPRRDFERLPWEQYRRDKAEYIAVSASRQRGFVVPPPLTLPPQIVAAPAPPPVIATQESLGDLKLYRVPIAVTLAAQSQKQVAMIDRRGATFDRIYSIDARRPITQPRPMTLRLRARNTEAAGLGVPLPAGGTALFAPYEGEDFLVREGKTADHAVGEEIEIDGGASADVRATIVPLARTPRTTQWRATITNARPAPIRAEIVVPGELVDPPAGIEPGAGGWRLPVSAPANGTASIEYTVR